MRSLDELQRCRVPGVHLKRVRHATARHKVYAVHTHQPELSRHGGGDPTDDVPHAVVRVGEDVPAVSEAARAERAVACEEARDSQGHRSAPVGREHDRAGRARDPLLQIAPCRHGPAPPGHDPAAAARGARLQEPPPPGWAARGTQADRGGRQSVGRERSCQPHGVPHSPQHRWRIAPQSAAPRERPHCSGMVLEARDVGHDVTRDAARSPQRRAHAEASPPLRPRDQDRRRPGAQIEIAEAVHGDDVIPRPRGRFGEPTRRNAGDEHAGRHHARPRRRRAWSREMT